MTLKKNILKSGLFALILSSTSVFAQQNDFNKWSVEGQFGVTRALYAYNSGYRMPVLGLFHAGIGTRYMTNNLFGLQVDFSYDQFKNEKESLEFTSHYGRGSVQAVFNVGNLMEFNNWTQRFGLLVHAGAGYSFMVAKGGNGVDNMGNVIVGASPIFKISEKVNINLDLSITTNLSQSRTFDFTATAPTSQRGYIFSGAVGVAFYIGKHEKHADWFHPIDPLKKEVDSLKEVMNTYKEKVNTLEDRVTKIETDLQDSDSDGVADKFDLEPDSTPNAKVDTKGRQVKEVILGTQSLDSLQGLFFTVQLGVYSHEVPSEVMKNITPLDTKTMPDGKIRYFSGAYQSQEEAAVKLEEAKKAGISDAFLTAYFRGSRITLVEAKTFIQELGPEILQQRKN